MLLDSTAEKPTVAQSVFAAFYWLLSPVKQALIVLMRPRLRMPGSALLIQIHLWLLAFEKASIPYTFKSLCKFRNLTEECSGLSIGTTDGHFAFQEEYTLPKFRCLLYFFKHAYFTISGRDLV